MKIKPQAPFDKEYRIAFVRPRKNGRMRIDLVRFNGSRKGMSYARYLMGVKLGQEVPEGMEVDHIDGDKTNDSIENLQVLSRKDHLKKTAEEKRSAPRRAKMVDRTCPVCSLVFKFPACHLPNRPNPCCSRTCGGLQGQKTAELKGTRPIKSPFINWTCKGCNVTFQVQERIFKKSSDPTCSRHCKGVVMNRNRRLKLLSPIKL